MRNIVLFCAAGMSTSLLVNKMKEAAKADGYDCRIEAFSLAKVPQEGPKADIILLGPQVRFNMNNVQSQCPGVPVEAIDMMDYGMMNGKKVIDQVKKVLGD